MTIDKETLKAMAECAAGFTDMSLAPDVVLALLAEIEGLHAQHGRDSGELRKLCSARDSARRQRDQLKTELGKVEKDRSACWAEFKVQGRRLDELKAENEALRKALGDLLALYEDDEGCCSLPEYIAGRAAMAKEAPHG